MSLIACWWNGTAVDALPVELRATHYGDGVFRTMLRCQGRIDAHDQQLDRLVEDAQMLGIEIARARIDRLLKEMALPDTAIVKMMVIRGGAARGYAPQHDAEPHILVFAYAPPRFPAAHWTTGIDAVTLQARLSAHAGLAGVKHCNRLDQVMASGELRRHTAAEGLCRGASGGYQCGTRSNIFWQQGRQLLTPRIDDCGVRGLTRDRIMARAAADGNHVQEVAAPGVQTLLDADAVFVCNSVFGIWPVGRLDGQAMPLSQTAQHWMQALAHPGLYLSESS